MILLATTLPFIDQIALPISPESGIVGIFGTAHPLNAPLVLLSRFPSTKIPNPGPQNSSPYRLWLREFDRVTGTCRGSATELVLLRIGVAGVVCW